MGNSVGLENLKAQIAIQRHGLASLERIYVEIIRYVLDLEKELDFWKAQANIYKARMVKLETKDGAE